MKILFVQIRFESNIAIMALSAFLKSKRFQTDILIFDGEKDYISVIKNEIKPDVIGFSSTTVDIKRLLAINRALKKEFNFFSIFGGPHPTFFPEVIEGEYAVWELLTNLNESKPITNISNLYIRNREEIHKNSIRPLIEDLDSLPFLDKDIYHKYYANRYLLDNVPIRFASSRGCPYKCTYCFNHKFFELYGIKGNIIRKRSVDSLIREIKEVKTKFNIPVVSFVDDTFCIPMEWIRDFSSKYKKEINLPYTINTRPNTLNKEIAQLLSFSGCYYVSFSIETGDEQLRNRLLKRNLKEQDILQAAQVLHKYGINFTTGNMLGIPGETFNTLRKTVTLNRKCRPHYAWASLFQPFPRLQLTSYAIKEGCFDGDFENIGEDQFTDSPLNLKRKKEIVRFHKFFALAVKYPFLNLLIMVLIKLPFDGFYDWLFKKYKVRFNKPVIEASKPELNRQVNESFLRVLRCYMEDFLDEKKFQGQR